MTRPRRSSPERRSSFSEKKNRRGVYLGRVPACIAPKSSRHEPLREAGVRGVDPQRPDLGGPQVEPGGDGLHGPAPVLRSRGGRSATSNFLNPWGEDREPAAWPPCGASR